jgi:diguanylate cyclase (GGDEF)-like protein
MFSRVHREAEVAVGLYRNALALFRTGTSDLQEPDFGADPGLEAKYMAEADGDLRRGMPPVLVLVAVIFVLFGVAHLSGAEPRGPDSAAVDFAAAFFLILCAAAMRLTRLGKASFIVPLGLAGAAFGSSLSSVVRQPLDPVGAQGVAAVCMIVVGLALVTPRRRDSVSWALAGIAAIAAPEFLVRAATAASLAPMALVVIAFCINVYASGYLERIRRRDFRLRRSYRTEARTDALTGLINRRCFVELYQREAARLQRQKRSFAVAIVDIDRFKAINDRHGHQAGDDVLKAMARLLEGTVRATDLVARWGGEEFAILFPDLSGDSGAVSAERIRAAIQDRRVGGGLAAGPVTVSIGVTAIEGIEDIERVIARADAALYRAKRNGRNRVEFEPL